MNADLQAIKDAWDVGTLESRETARSLADAFVAANPERYEGFGSATLEDLVTLVETFRIGNLDEKQWETEAYLLHKFAPQNIGGVYQPQLRIVGS